MFWAALALTFMGAILPADLAPQIFHWDKAEHFVAFYVLAIFAAAAYSRQGLFFLGASLSGVGALIELIQALPLVHRDADFKDWVADTVAITAALAPIVLNRWRIWMNCSN